MSPFIKPEQRESSSLVIDECDGMESVATKGILAPTALKVFFAATFGYSLYYTCRLSLSVVKGPLVDGGYLSEFQLGLIGSALFYSYAVGKLVNGFWVDRVNVRKFAAIGLLVSAVINLVLGFYAGFYLFFGLWLVNGWVQSMGACSFIVGLTRWFPPKRLGTFYGFWSASHNIGEGMTFILTAFVVTHMGWQAGWWWSALLGLAGVLLIWLFFRNSPHGAVGVTQEAPTVASHEGAKAAQLKLLKNPAIWLIALASMFMYVSRYSINSWGIFFLEKSKAYSVQEASMIISVSSVCGVVGTIASGWISDKLFKGMRSVPTILAGILNVISISVFLLCPRMLFLDIVSMVFFGITIGALICYLGGLIAVDIAAKGATGAALGIVGMASYAGAGTQDIISGYLIGSNKTGVQGDYVYNFLPMGIFWITAASLSVLMSLMAWRLSRKATT
jgi:OPA family sugar phosphate sensor protein UhpC-like MFS transporter